MDINQKQAPRCPVITGTRAGTVRFRGQVRDTARIDLGVDIA